MPEPGVPGVSREHQNGVLQAVPRGVSPRVSRGHQNEIAQAVPREDQSGASQGLSGAVGIFQDLRGGLPGEVNPNEVSGQGCRLIGG